MIERLDISGVHMEVDDDLRKYVQRKIGHLDRYIPKHSRESVHAEIKLKGSKAKDKKECTCEVELFLPHEILNHKESTVNMYAAVDIVETKLKNQLKKYKGLHANPRLHQRVIARFRHSVA
jgi:putative sigma-54 modulation protein